MKKIVRKFLWKFRLELSLLLLSLVTIIAFIPVFTYLYFAKDLRSKESIMNRNDTGVVLLDRKDKPFFTFYEAHQKDFVPLKQIPKVTQEAVIAAEDREFYQHPGFSIRGIFRSLFLDLQKKDAAYGGSTLTQQLVKNVLLNSKRNILRKYQEIVLAQEIERRYKKDEILEMYLNSVYFGEGAFGIKEAAKIYFGKDVSKLSIEESALLAGILPAPSEYSPLHGSERKAKSRQVYVLSSMRQLGYISANAKEQAQKKDLHYSTVADDINSTGAHFALSVKEALIKKYGEERISRSGFRVKTTLDLDWQKYAERTIAEQVTRLAADKVTNGAAVVIDPKNGEVRVMVGSKDWFDNKFGKVNVTTSLRSPGSSFKPIIYAAAFEKRIITPASPLRDNATTFPGNYKPLDFDRKFRGTVLVRRALANSLNIPAVEVMQKVGIDDGLEMGRRLGLTTLRDRSQYGLSLVLGTAEVKLLEMTNVYATFANHGVKNDIATIDSIIDKAGEVVYENNPNSQPVLEPAVAFLISSILSDNQARAEEFGNALTVSRPAAVKTGTAEDYHDALTMGYTPSLAVGVWVGNNDNTSMDRIAGSLGAAPIWKSLIEHLSDGTPVEQFSKPEGITTRNICTYNGLLVRKDTTAGLQEYFLPGTEPVRYCSVPRPTSMPAPTGQGGVQITIPTISQEIQVIPENEKEKKEKPGHGGPDQAAVEHVQQQMQENIEKMQQQLQEQLQVSPQ